MTIPYGSPQDCQRDHEPTEGDLAEARKILGSSATDDEIYTVAEIQRLIQCREEPCGAGADPFGRTADDWKHHAE